MRHISDGTTPIPTDLDEFVADLQAQAAIVLSHHGADLTDGILHVREEDLYADESIRQMWNRSATTVRFDDPQVSVSIDYLDAPVAVPDTTKALTVTVHNPHPDDVVAHLSWLLPEGWQAADAASMEVGAQSSSTVDVALRIPAEVPNTSVAYAAVSLRGYPIPPAVPVTLIGAALWQVADRVGAPDAEFSASVPDTGEPAWRTEWGSGNALPLDRLIAGPGTCLLRTFLEAGKTEETRIGLVADTPRRVWLDGELLQDVPEHSPMRPNYTGANPSATLSAGWHEYVVEFRVDADDIDPQAHLLIHASDRLCDGNTTLGRTRLPSNR